MFAPISDKVDANPRNRAKFLEGFLGEVLVFVCEMNFGTMGNQMVNKGMR